ncbi:MAG: hypothetical protein M4579_002376 [Chaenotheca gracillima]|nr:MAG: hypothetical protein M4579_002376 [Chaenotheca gracillima]
MATLPTLLLNDQTKIPMIGFGTGTAWYKKDPSAPLDRDLIESIKTAIKLGYIHLDGAEVYNTEPELGVAIKESGVRRDQLYVVTKVMHGVNDIPSSFNESLKKLGLDYVDLYLIHSPFFADSDADFRRTWSDMETIKKSGRAKSIGVSNYLPKHLEPLLETATIWPSINQIEYHPYLQHGPSDLVAFHQKNNIALSAYGPLTAVTKAKPGPADDVYASLAKKYGVTEGQIALRWCMDQGIVPITTSSKESRMKEYLSALEFKLTPEEVQEISKAGANKLFRGFWKHKFDSDDGS